MINSGFLFSLSLTKGAYQFEKMWQPLNVEKACINPLLNSLLYIQSSKNWRIMKRIT